MHQTTEFLRSMGYDISFLLYPFDQDWEKSVPDYYRQLVGMFDYFAIVPNSRPLHLNAQGAHHLIDEWWDENLERHLQWLLARKSFDVMFVNYAFFSRAFDLAPRHCLKILDTHDLFAGRRETFAKYGVDPEFFYTNEEQEKIAFDRADAVIAIKESEAEHIGQQTKRFVVNLPYWDGFAGSVERPPLPAEFTHERRLRLGFIGAQNSVNSVNMNRFLTRFNRYVRLYDLPIEIVIAGNVCKQIPAEFPFVKKLGRVAEIGDFYGAIDAIVAPLEFSTGIKIKVAEAMAWGVPVVATANAFDGFQAFHRLQTEPSVASLCESLAALAVGEIALTDIAEAGRRSGEAAAQAQDRGFSALRAWIRANTKRNVVATTRAFWRRKDFVDEQLAQATEFLSQVARTIVFVSNPESVQKEWVHGDIDFVRAPQDDWPQLCHEIGSFGHISALLIGEGGLALESADVEASKFWRLDLRRGLRRPDSGPRAEPSGATSTLSSLLHYAPFGCVAPLEASRVAIVSGLTASEWEEAAADLATFLCDAQGLAPHRIRVGDHDWEGEGFFARVVAETASRWLLLGPGAWTRVLQQTAIYRGAACMLARPDLLAPQIVDEQGWPSLMGSLAAFLDGTIQAAPTSSGNTGWNELWT